MPGSADSNACAAPSLSVASDSTAGQPSAVAAGPFDTGQARRAEPAQPLQQAGIPGRGGPELGPAQQLADGIERGSDMHIRQGAAAAVSAV